MEPRLSRRSVVVGGGLCVLAGCTSYGPEPEPETPRLSGTVEIDAVDIPVGGGLILAHRGVVVTQPTAGTYRAFRATCTHAGCPLAGVTETINCDCHGSRFALADGAVVDGPATQGLTTYTATRAGETVRVTA